MRHFTRSRVAATALLVGLGSACTDGPTATHDASAPSLPALKEAKAVVTAAASAAGGYDFTVDPTHSQTYLFGEHGVYFPAHSICDPALSSYGPDEWDKPCVPLTKPITIHVDVATVDGHPRVEFDRHLRFVPRPLSDHRHWVILYLRDDTAADEPRQPRRRQGPREYTIVWEAPDGTLVDESVYDNTMRTKVHTLSGTVSRRIKHFSGYMVAARAGAARAIE